MAIWPDLNPDLGHVLAGLLTRHTVEFVWENEVGLITSTIAEETRYQELAAHVAGARAAASLSHYVNERHPLFAAVLPDGDGILRARWRTESAPSVPD